MIRMLIPLVILFLVYLLARTFMEGSRERPIDVDPVDASTEREDARRADRGTGADAGGTVQGGVSTSEPAAEDDIIDVEPVAAEEGRR